jgi:hypothetical protein
MKNTNVNFDVLKFPGAKNLIKRASKLNAELAVKFFKDERGSFAEISVELPGKTLKKVFHEQYGEKVLPLPLAHKPRLRDRYVEACKKAGFAFSQKTLQALIVMGIVEPIEEVEE